jgi:hypothetical protein
MTEINEDFSGSTFHDWIIEYGNSAPGVPFDFNVYPGGMFLTGYGLVS